MLLNLYTSFSEPIFIVGFHHSGTRLISKLLLDAGLFQPIGTPSHESGHIQKINSSIMSAWYDELAVRNFKPTPSLCNNISKLGLIKLLLLSGYRGGQPWGHKDPRTSYTLPCWLAKFPKAQVVHVVRDPLDVIGTLGENYAKFSQTGLPPHQDLGFWSRLWISYLDKILETGPKARNFVEVKFEDICTSPKFYLNKLIASLGMPTSNAIDVSFIRSDKIGLHKKWISDGRINNSSLEKLQSQVVKYRQYYNYM